MALATPQDLAILGTWNILGDYTKNQVDFVAVGKIVYQVLTTHSGNPPSGPNDIEQVLTAALQVADIFKSVCAAKQHANPSLYPVFASSLARYMLDNDWTNITQP